MQPVSANLQVDWSRVQLDLATMLKGELNGVLAGTADDLNNFALAISNDMTRAIREGRADLISELKGQARLLIEMNRLRLTGLGESILDTALGVGLRVASIALGGVTGWLASGPVR